MARRRSEQGRAVTTFCQASVTIYTCYRGNLIGRANPR